MSRHLRAVDEPEPELSASGQFPPLLSEETFEALAQCRSVEKFPFRGRESLAFTFKLWDCPFGDAELICYAPFQAKWKKRLPTSSKLLKMWVAAGGERRVRNLSLKVLREKFVNGVFRVRVRPSGDVAKYSVIDCVLRREA